MNVIRHRCTGWVEDSLGESRAKTFVDDTSLEAFAFDPGGTTLNASAGDVAVTSTPTIYFVTQIPAHEYDEYDEWTVFGERYLQDGRPSHWDDPFPGHWLNGTVVKLERRRG